MGVSGPSLLIESTDSMILNNIIIPAKGQAIIPVIIFVMMWLEYMH